VPTPKAHSCTTSDKVGVFAAIALVFAALGAVSIVLFTFTTGVGPVPTSGKATQAMLDAVGSAPPGRVLDLGSGWGTLAVACARRFPQREVIGYERSWVPWAVASLARRMLRLQNLSFHRADFLEVNLSGENTVLLCYLFRRGMQRVADKLAREGPPALLVSNTFSLPSATPDEVTRLDDLYRTRIYVYRWRR
jgi:hypothetical protein